MTLRPVVLVDATAIPGDVGGVGRYLEEVVAACDGDPRLRLVVLAQHDHGNRFRRLAPGSSVVAVSPLLRRRPLRLLWEQFALPRLARRHSADVIFSPHYTMSLALARKTAVTLHDATFFTDPGVHHPLKRIFFRSWIRLSLRFAARCIVPSAATRDELARVTRTRAEQMTVIHHGVDTAVFRPPTEVERERASDIVGSTRWIAFLGTLEPRKNVGALVRAFATVADEMAKEMPGLTLALAGARGWDVELDATIAASPQAARITRLGYLDLEDLPGFLGGAAVVSYPSLGEGFGLPVLEAMACGAAVLTTERLALPEVGGSAVAYSEPDSDSIGSALTALLSDAPRRSELGRLARERAAEFGWPVSASRHVDVFLAIAERNR